MEDCFKAINLHGFNISPKSICLRHEEDDIITLSLIFNNKTLTNLIYDNKGASHNEIRNVYSTIKDFLKKGEYEVSNQEDNFFEFKIDPVIYDVLKTTRKKIKHYIKSSEERAKKLEEYEELKKNISKDNPELANLKNVPYNYQTKADFF